jgi:NTE family protein
MTKGGVPPRSGTAVALSGGGYRAMLFHLGFLWRLRDAGILANIDRFSSVSGGSIVAGMLAVAWDRLDLDDAGTSFRELVARPVVRLAGERIDVLAAFLGRIPGLSGAWTRGVYDEFLYGSARLNEMPKHPRFVFCATSLHSGKPVRINETYLADWTTGQWGVADLMVSDAVAASSAFPPVLSPVVFDLSGHPFKAFADSRHAPPDRLFLTDGGVYDNLGIEAVWDTHKTIYVSDAGAAFHYTETGPFLLSSQAMQVVGIMQDQIGSLRFRQMNAAFAATNSEDLLHRDGFLVSSDFLIDPPPLGSLPFDRQHALALAATPTRLTRLTPDRAMALVNWGYIATDHRIRARDTNANECNLPYPEHFI